MATYDTGAAREILALIKDATSQKVVQDWLRDSGHRPFSAGNWPEMFDRVLAAVEAKVVSNEKLVDLLRDVEEHGEQHVFLYRDTKLAYLAERSETAMQALAADQLDALVDHPRIERTPAEPTVVDVRWETSPHNALIIKIVEVRVSRKYAGFRVEGSQYLKVYDITSQRVVHIVRVREDGLIELRIASQDNSTKYEGEIARLWKFFSNVIPKGRHELDLATVKARLFNDRSKFGDEIRFSSFSLKNSKGTDLHASSGRFGNLIEDEGAHDSMTAFHESTDSDTWCDRTNLWFLKSKSGALPSSDIHVETSGLHHEFCVAQSCSKDDYEHVLRQILLYNKGPTPPTPAETPSAPPAAPTS